MNEEQEKQVKTFIKRKEITAGVERWDLWFIVVTKNVELPLFHVNHLLPLSMVIFIWEVLIDLIREIVSKNYELPVCIFVKFKERSFIVLVSLISEQFEFFHKDVERNKTKNYVPDYKEKWFSV